MVTALLIAPIAMLTFSNARIERQRMEAQARADVLSHAQLIVTAHE